MYRLHARALLGRSVVLATWFNDQVPVVPLACVWQLKSLLGMQLGIISLRTEAEGYTLAAASACMATEILPYLA